MAVMQQFFNNVLKLSTEGHFPQLAEYCRKAIPDILTRNAGSLDNILPTFDLQHHSLGILSVLYVKLRNIDRSDIEPIMAQLQEFFSGCNGEQIRMMPDVFSDICHKLTEILTAKNQCARGIPLMRDAINRLRNAPTQLTPVHADLCQLCLHAKILKPVLPYLDTDITDILKENDTTSDPKYFLAYYYYGGMIYATLKNFARSFFFFEVAITTPCTAVSHIMLESYKKYVLVSLLLNGRFAQPPKYTSNVVNRFIHPLCVAYTDLASAYINKNSNKIQSVSMQHQQVYVTDRNSGLVKQVINSLFRRNIQRLTKTFVTLSLADVASKCHLETPAQAEQHILNMIEDGEIFATINQRDGMVYFEDNPEKFASLETLQALEQQLEQCIAQEKLVRSMDEGILLSADFQRKVNKTSSNLPDDEGLGLVLP